MSRSATQVSCWAAALVLVWACAGHDSASAQTAEPHAERRPLLRQIDAERRAIATAKRILSSEEVECAFNDFSMPVRGACAQIKAAANRDAKKGEAWIALMIAWNALDRLLLSLRGVEDGLGVVCLSR
jgi:hypothetical protein